MALAAQELLALIQLVAEPCKAEASDHFGFTYPALNVELDDRLGCKPNCSFLDMIGLGEDAPDPK